MSLRLDKKMQNNTCVYFRESFQIETIAIYRVIFYIHIGAHLAPALHFNMNTNNSIEGCTAILVRERCV
jgi:hypothetical protein